MMMNLSGKFFVSLEALTIHSRQLSTQILAPLCSICLANYMPLINLTTLMMSSKGSVPQQTWSVDVTPSLQRVARIGDAGMITLANRPTIVVADNKKMTTMEPDSSKTVVVVRTTTDARMTTGTMVTIVIVMEIGVMVPSPQ
jgi:hypothetical protein